MLVILSGIAMAFNILIILHKIRNLMIMNALVDIVTLGLIIFLTAGTYSGMVTGMIASVFISAYLWFFPLREPRIVRVLKEKLNKRGEK